MTSAEKYEKIGEHVQALRDLVRCSQRCLLKNHKNHDDLCAISFADVYVKAIFETMESPDK